MKRLLIMAFFALFALASCEKDYTQDLAGTSWSAVETLTGSFQGTPTQISLRVEMNFLAEAQGHINIHFNSAIDGQTILSDDRSNDFTFTFDGRNGVITTIPNEGEAESRYMFHRTSDDEMNMIVNFNQVDYRLNFHR